jgi:hypothetical protein
MEELLRFRRLENPTQLLPHREHCILITKTNQLMLFKEATYILHTEQINTHYEQNATFFFCNIRQVVHLGITFLKRVTFRWIQYVEIGITFLKRVTFR